MKKILFLLILLLTFSCEKKQEFSYVGRQYVLKIFYQNKSVEKVLVICEKPRYGSNSTKPIFMLNPAGSSVCVRSNWYCRFRGGVVDYDIACNVNYFEIIK